MLDTAAIIQWSKGGLKAISSPLLMGNIQLLCSSIE
jgi:hypothetical protein